MSITCRTRWGILLAVCVLQVGTLTAQDRTPHPLTTTLTVSEAAAYVEAVFSNGQEEAYASAADIYLLLLGVAGDPLEAQDQALVRRHVARMILLLPTPLQQRIAEGKVRTLEGRLREGWRLKPGAGRLLVAWWRAQDSLPGTPRHERLEEHLRRSAWADAAYPSSYTLSGWDDRGLLYVRLGTPTLRRSVSFSDPRLLRILEKTSIPIRIQDFPENAVWIYEDYGDAAYYIFTERDGVYTLGSVLDLIPSSLRLVSGRRNNLLVKRPPIEKTEILLEALRAVFKELAAYHPDLGQAYMDIASYIEVGGGESAGLERGFSENKVPAHIIALNQISEVRSKETRVVVRREETVPLQRSQVLEEIPLLPMAVRWARFLDANGTTRTEVYWSLAARALAPPDRPSFNRYLFNATAIQRNDDYTPRVFDIKRTVIRTNNAAPPDAIIPVQTLAVRGDTSRYHLQVQWDQYGLQGQDSATQKASTTPLQRGFFRVDSLEALNPDEAVLTMSDLVPIRAEDLSAFDDLQEGQGSLDPYPFFSVTERDSIGLYFEIYHLRYGANDRTQYEVAVEVRRKKKGGWGGLIRGGQDIIAARTAYEGGQRTAKETLILALDEWIEGEVVVTIRVTDSVSGQQVERSVDFVLAS